MTRHYLWCWLLVGSTLAGCGGLREEPAGTGAKECVESYYDALVRKDWPAAYACLDANSQKHCTPQHFSELAQSYRRKLGFEPEAAQVRACEERGTEATAHVVVTGRAATVSRRYKDTVMLRRNDEWRVVLPPNFGQALKR